jgi:hypothetical protein
MVFFSNISCHMYICCMAHTSHYIFHLKNCWLPSKNKQKETSTKHGCNCFLQLTILAYYGRNFFVMSKSEVTLLVMDIFVHYVRIVFRSDPCCKLFLQCTCCVCCSAADELCTFDTVVLKDNCSCCPNFILKLHCLSLLVIYKCIAM